MSEKSAGLREKSVPATMTPATLRVGPGVIVESTALVELITLPALAHTQPNSPRADVQARPVEPGAPPLCDANTTPTRDVADRALSGGLPVVHLKAAKAGKSRMVLDRVDQQLTELTGI